MMNIQMKIPLDLPPLFRDDLVNAAKKNVSDIVFTKSATRGTISKAYEIPGQFRIEWVAYVHQPMPPMYALTVAPQQIQPTNIYMPTADLARLYNELAKLYAAHHVVKGR